MEVTFEQLREKEIINISNGKKLGRIVDLSFELSTGNVKGIFVPGDKKLFKKVDDIFIPIRQIQRIGDDVILVRLSYIAAYENDTNRLNIGKFENRKSDKIKLKKNGSFIRYRRISNNKYK